MSPTVRQLALKETDKQTARLKQGLWRFFLFSLSIFTVYVYKVFRLGSFFFSLLFYLLATSSFPNLSVLYEFYEGFLFLYGRDITWMGRRSGWMDTGGVLKIFY